MEISFYLQANFSLYFCDSFQQFAPGDRITSAWRDKRFDRATISGTSGAAAHAAGVAALVLEKYRAMTPEEMKRNLQMHAEVNAVRGILDDGDTTNLLLNMATLAHHD